MLNDEDFLAHAGKKGMKWGVRKNKKAKVGKRSYNARKLSNQELSAVVKRMELEQKYTKLNKRTAVVGEKWALTQLKKHGPQLALSAATVAAGAAFSAYMARKGGGSFKARPMPRMPIAALGR